MYKDSFYHDDELKLLGLKKYGKNVKISRNASLYSPQDIEVGDNIRIDDFCILSGSITLKNFIHISAYTALYGKFGIVMESYTGLSPRCIVFSASDDFSGEYMIGPMLPTEYTNVKGGIVHFKENVQIGANTIVLPGITIQEGTVVGAMSLVNRNLESWGIYAGIPVRKIKDRKRGILKLKEKFLLMEQKEI